MGTKSNSETPMDFTVNPELQKLIEEEVKSGRSTNPDEFLDKAIYHYVIARDLGEDYTRDEVEEKIARALAQVERGETVDGEEAFRQLRAYSAERRQHRA
jgi:antitoxin ParD1/3/4